MVFEVLFFLELFLVFFLSKMLSKTMSFLFLYLTKKHTTSIHLIALLFLPGVIIHELSHAIVAGMLFVPVHTIEFMPKIYGNYVKLGSVSIAKTDPIKRFVIGVSPILSGLTIVFSVYFYMIPFSLSKPDWKLFLFIFILFEVGNTMFSSRRDLEGAFTLCIAFFCIGAVSFLLGYRIPPDFFTFLSKKSVVEFFKSIDAALLVLILIDVSICVVLFWGIKKFYNRRR